MKLKKIETRITAMVVLAVLGLSIAIGALSMSSNRNSTQTAIEKNLGETAELAALAAQNMISTYTVTIAEIASNPTLLDGEISLAEKQAFLDTRVEAYYMRFGGLADASGYDAYHGVDISGEPFYRAALRGESAMSAPYVDGTDAYLMVAAPVMDGGRVAGVIYFQCDTYILQSIVEGIRIGEKGEAYVLDGEGTVIACGDQGAVLERRNVLRQAAASPRDRALQARAAIEEKMIAGESGVGQCDGFFQGYAPIQDSGGWSIAVRIDKGEFLRSVMLGNLFIALVCLVLSAVVIVISIRVSRSIARPIVSCADRLRTLAQGDLKSPVPQVASQDEIRVLSDSTAELVAKFGRIVEEIGRVLGAIAGGDLTRESDGAAYPGDFGVLREYLTVINERLNQTMSGIVSAAREVSSGSAQVASTGAVLSQGAAEQADAVERLSGSVEAMNRDAKETARLADQGKRTVNSAGAKLQESGASIQRLNEAMAGITESSNEIGRIIAAIENIAFQTNILALNAAVEAARAGSLGKGFAVVADEVRSLAIKSDEAAKASQDLIRRSVEAVSNGSAVVEEVTRSVRDVAGLAGEAVRQMDEVARAVEKQTGAIEEMAGDIAQISGVVQSNSATAQQSAATSQEMSGQAEVLKNLVGGFTLR